VMSNRVLLGNRGGTYGLWVSRPGQDVITANTSQLLFDSASATVRILAQGTAAFTPGGSNTVSISYGLTAPTNSGPTFYNLYLDAIQPPQNFDSLYSFSITNTGVDVTRATYANSWDLVVYWQLVTEVGGL
jgi:hypothetical protein